MYNPAFYGGVIKKQPFSFSLQYFYSLVLALAFIVTLILSFTFVPAVVSFMNALGPNVVSRYPGDLVITLSRGEVSISKPEPYIFPMPAELKISQDSKQKENLFVIDTKTPFTLDIFNSYHTYALITKNNFIFFDDKGGIRIESLASAPDITVDKASIQEKLALIRPYLKIIGPFLVVGLFFLFIIVASAYLVYLLFGALCIWLIAWFMGLHVGYKKSYQVGLHAVTVPGLAAIILNVVFPGWQVPFLFTILLLLTAAINLAPLAKARD